MKPMRIRPYHIGVHYDEEMRKHDSVLLSKKLMDGVSKLGRTSVIVEYHRQGKVLNMLGTTDDIRSCLFIYNREDLQAYYNCPYTIFNISEKQ